MEKVGKIFALFSLTLSLSLLGLSATAATDEAQQKLNNRNLSAMERELKNIEKHVASQKYTNASRSVKNALKAYNRMPEDFQQTQKVTTLKAKLEEQSATIEVAAANAKREKTDKRHISSAQRYIKQAESTIASNRYGTGYEAIEKAKQSLGRVSTEGQEGEAYQSLVEQLETFSVEFKAAEKAYTESVNATLGAAHTKNELPEFIQQNNILLILSAGATDTVEEGELSYLETLKTNYPALPQIKQQFLDKFGELAQSEPDYENPSAPGVTPRAILDVFANAETYKANIVKQIGNNHLNEVRESMASQVEKTTQYGSIPADVMTVMYGDSANDPMPAVAHAAKYYEWANQTMPKETVDAIAEYKVELRKALENSAKNNAFDSKAYGYKNQRIEELAGLVCKKSNNSSLVKSAVIGKDEWTIEKNALDVPVRRYHSGFVLCQHPDEPFKRGYKAGFYAEYMGGGQYAEVATVDANMEYVKPYK